MEMSTIDISNIAEENHNYAVHLFFPNQGNVEMSEVEILFLPLLNMLEELYTA